MSNEELIEFGSITAFLKAFSINRRSALCKMNIEEQTNFILNASNFKLNLDDAVYMYWIDGQES